MCVHVCAIYLLLLFIIIIIIIGDGEDYNETSTYAVFPAGTNTSTVIRVTLTPDDIDEFTEEFTATLKGSGDFADRIDFFRQDTVVEIIDSDGKQ